MNRKITVSVLTTLALMTSFATYAADDIAGLSFKADTRALEKMQIERDQLAKLLRSVLLVTASSKPTKDDIRLGLAFRIAGPNGDVFMRQGKLKTTSADALMSGAMRAGEVLIINGLFEEPLRQVDFPKVARFVGVSYPGTDVFEPKDERAWKKPSGNVRDPGECIFQKKWVVSVWAYGEGLPLEKSCKNCAVNLCFDSAM